MSQNKKAKSGRRTRGILTGAILILLLVAEIVWLPRLFSPWIVTMTFLLSLIPWIIFLIWFYLAPNNYFFTFVDEGTAKAIMKGGAFVRAIMQWTGYTLNPKNWDIVKVSARHKAPWHPFGGLRWVGIWPFTDIYVYKFAWIGVNYKGEHDPHPPEWLDYCYTKPDFMLCDTYEAETIPPQNLPLDFYLSVKFRIINIKKALFGIDNWLEMALNKLRGITVTYARKYTWHEILLRQNRIGTEIKQLAEVEGVLKEIRSHGIKVESIDLLDVGPTRKPTTDLRKKILERFIAEQEKGAIIVKAEAESEKRARESIGVIVHMLSQATGLKPDTIRKRIKKDKTFYNKIKKLSSEIVIRQVTPNLLDIRTKTEGRKGGASALEEVLLSLVAVANSLPLRKTSTKTSTKTKKSSAKRSKS